MASSQVPDISAMTEMFTQAVREGRVVQIPNTPNAITVYELERLSTVFKYDFALPYTFTASASSTPTLLDLVSVVKSVDFSADNSANLINGISGLELMLLNQVKYGTDSVYAFVFINGEQVYALNNDTIQIASGDVVSVFPVYTYDPSPYKGDEISTDGAFNAQPLNTLLFRIQTDFSAIVPATNGTFKAEINATRYEMRLGGQTLQRYRSEPSSMILLQKREATFNAMSNPAMIKNFLDMNTGAIIDSMVILTYDENGKLSDKIVERFEIEDRAGGGSPRFYFQDWLIAKLNDIREKRFANSPSGVVFLDETLHSGGLNLIGNKTGDVVFNVMPAVPNKSGKVAVIFAVRQMSTLPHLASATRDQTDPRA